MQHAFAAAALSLAAALLYFYVRRAPPALTKTYARFPIVSRYVANGVSPRPVIFLTVHVSTASLPTGAHVKVRAIIDGEVVVRSYTPTRFSRNECELMFRVYAGGPMTTFLAGLKVGDTVEMIGPTGLERYGSHGPGTFSKGERVWRGVSNVALVCGGTGITPMLQIANHVLQDPRDATRLSLVSFTNSVEDIILEDTLRALAQDSRDALKLTFVASTKKGEEERSDVVIASMRTLTVEAAKNLLGVPVGPETVVCVCGPRGFCERATELFAEVGFENVLVW